VVLARQSNPSQSRKKHDFYETKQYFADWHINRLYHLHAKPLMFRNVIDVGMGHGVYGKAVRKYSGYGDFLDTVEIDPDRCKWDYQSVYDRMILDDFRKIDFGFNYDLVIGNPPYKDVHQFVMKGIELLTETGTLSFLLKGSFAESATRYEEIFSIHRPFSIWTCALRPVAKHAEMYCVFNFGKQPSEITQAHWIYADAKGKTGFI